MRRVLLVLVSALLCVPAFAATKPKASVKAAPRKVAAAKAAAPVQTAHRRSPYVGAISVDAATGRVLFEQNADTEAYPASVTKLMTLLLVMEDVKAGKYSYDDRVEATAGVERFSEPSWIGAKTGEKLSVRDLCTALMVESANDAAIFLAVHSAGSWEAFVARMNARAAELGMVNTKYYNPNGLPPISIVNKREKHYPWKSFNVSTARDQMLLARQLVKMPEVLSLTSVKTCDLVKTADGFRVSVTRRTNSPNTPTSPANDERIIMSMCNHNNVMVKDKLKILNSDGSEVVDGLKTGYTREAGSSVVLTGSRKGKRVIVVVLGSDSQLDEKGRVVKLGSVVRDETARHLLSDALGSLVW